MVHKLTFSERLKEVMEEKNITPAELERISGVTRQSIGYILNNNLKKSKLSIQLATALNVSHQWLADGIEDKTFVKTKELIIFSDIYLLMSYINSNNIPDNSPRTITHNKYLDVNDFVFHPKNSKIYYYCSISKSIKATEFLNFDIQNNTYSTTEKIKDKKFSFPIIEKKIVNME